MEIVTAMNAADRLKGTLAAIFDKVDMILAPAIPMLPWPLGTWEEAFRAGDPSALWLFRYTLPFNITHNPTVTFPAGSENGLPIGVQVIGRHFDEALLLRAAHSFQLQTNWHRLRPDLAR